MSVAKTTVQREAFVVRTWRETELSVWRAWVQHVRTGEAVCVTSPEALTAFIIGAPSKLR